MKRLGRKRLPQGKRAPELSRFYGRIGAQGWRGSKYFTFSVRSPMLRRWLAGQLPARPVRLLSIGCGSGELEAHLLREGHGVVGLDLSTAMLKRARKRGLEALVQADSESLPFRAARFDVVLFPECVGYLNLPIAFAEAARVLRRRGRLLITTYSGAVELHAAYRRVALAEIAEALAAAGLRVAEQRFLAAKRTAVTAVPSDDGSTLLYVLARHAQQRSAAPPVLTARRTN